MAQRSYNLDLIFTKYGKSKLQYITRLSDKKKLIFDLSDVKSAILSVILSKIADIGKAGD